VLGCRIKASRDDPWPAPNRQGSLTCWLCARAANAQERRDAEGLGQPRDERVAHNDWRESGVGARPNSARDFGERGGRDFGDRGASRGRAPRGDRDARGADSVKPGASGGWLTSVFGPAAHALQVHGHTNDKHEGAAATLVLSSRTLVLSSRMACCLALLRLACGYHCDTRQYVQAWWVHVSEQRRLEWWTYLFALFQPGALALYDRSVRPCIAWFSRAF